jgi:two-component system nitrate/nitrite response regulator NarL
MAKKPATIRILLAGSQTIFRAGLKRLLEWENGLVVVGEAPNREECARLVRELNPDIVLLDPAVPTAGPAPASGNPLEFWDGLRGLPEMDGVRKVVLVSQAEENSIARILCAGARGAVLKSSGADVLVECIRAVMKGKFWAGDKPADSLAAAQRRQASPVPETVPANLFRLTRRETQILSAVVSGYLNREIAKKLSISEDTVKHHLTNIFDKVGVANRLELALFAIHHGLVSARR